MLKLTRILLISLSSFLHCVTCNMHEDALQKWITYLPSKLGSCSEYFQYQRIDEFINGQLKLPNIKMGDTVKLAFYNSDEATLGLPNGIFLPDQSSPTIMNRLQNGQTISYRVDFPITLDVPQLLKISVNDKELCSTKRNDLLNNDSSYQLLFLKHTMQIINGSLPVFTYNIYIPDFAENSICGLIDERISSNGITPLSYSRSEIVRGEYPWLAAIYNKRRSGINFLCGGTIVSSRIILTAAHCFQGSNLNADKIVAVLGRHNLTNYLEDSYAIYEIEALILNPEYKHGIGFSDADLAILTLKNRASFTQFIKQICLWFGPADESLVVNRTGVVAGWGSDEVGYTLSAIPKKVKLDIASETACLHSSPAYSALTSARTLCAGNSDGSGPCEGDSGGGLIINRFGRWMLRGVVSAELTGQNRCNFKVFCDVAKHTTWLEKYVKQKKIISGSIEDICGISGTDLRSEHPWLAAVYIKLNTGIKFFNTGSLISSRTVLIRAGSLFGGKGHNVSPAFLRIYLGRYDLNRIQENEVVSRDVAGYVIHPDFNDSTSLSNFQENGIALLQMKSPVDFTEYIKPICLWSESNGEQSYNVEQSVTLSSWDSTIILDNDVTVPTSIKVKITSIQQCQSWGYDEIMSSRILCVPRLEKKRGGIMMIKRNGRWLLRGLNALRLDYSSYMSKDFFVYHDLAKYLKWIQNTMLA